MPSLIGVQTCHHYSASSCCLHTLQYTQWHAPAPSWILYMSCTAQAVNLPMKNLNNIFTLGLKSRSTVARVTAATGFRKLRNTNSLMPFVMRMTASKRDTDELAYFPVTTDQDAVTLPQGLGLVRARTFDPGLHRGYEGFAHVHQDSIGEVKVLFKKGFVVIVKQLQ